MLGSADDRQRLSDSRTSRTRVTSSERRFCSLAAAKRQPTREQDRYYDARKMTRDSQLTVVHSQRIKPVSCKFHESLRRNDTLALEHRYRVSEPNALEPLIDDLVCHPGGDSEPPPPVQIKETMTAIHRRENSSRECRRTPTITKNLIDDLVKR